ncbi:Transcriptional regulator, HxlR family [Castellaniella defragrans 65Phen]|jgi:DNA-binding HxlR family transcriptional regulator|uniref:Transcriptional regulator, HxlR family n=2 Tax=Castellaniella defragrans TaxID=75697 RepID=W8X087_CASD6|nr:Transcriptional regulator, HxlR family [Castellaniella defragrans 65Phen]
MIQSRIMSTKRSYADGCAAAHALDLIGERWALLIVRELMLGPKRFTDLRAGLGRISANVLTQRLAELEAAGIVVRRRLPPPGGGMAYDLSPWGRELEPILLQLVRWGVRSPGFARGAPLNVDAMVLSMRALFSPDAASGRDARILLVLDGQPFSARVASGRLDVHRQGPAEPAAEATLETSPTTLLHLAYGAADPDDAVEAGLARISGRRAALDRFLGCFRVPEPADTDR